MLFLVQLLSPTFILSMLMLSISTHMADINHSVSIVGGACFIVTFVTFWPR
uniref:Uncharacterized protein n=1 Tax=Octopus bimaculoides TaxID=37653 RepID=A0A0L8GJU1_OCTBM